MYGQRNILDMPNDSKSSVGCVKATNTVLFSSSLIRTLPMILKRYNAKDILIIQ